MGQRARNAGKKKSKICSKKADTKSLKHNIPRQARKKIQEISKDESLLETALFCPKWCVNGDGTHYKELADWIWENKTTCTKNNFHGYPVLNTNISED